MFFVNLSLLVLSCYFLAMPHDNTFFSLILLLAIMIAYMFSLKMMKISKEIEKIDYITYSEEKWKKIENRLDAITLVSTLVNLLNIFIKTD